MARAPSLYDLNVYLSFVMNAVVGQMGEADALMRAHGGTVKRVARWLAKDVGLPVRPAYRGLLLEPSLVVDGKVQPDSRYTFASYSESRDVACWFADRNSVMSEYVLQKRPGVQGYLSQRTPSKNTILFHHSWREFPTPRGRIPLAALAANAGMVAADQLAWNLQTQREVIMLPPTRPFEVEEVGAEVCPSTADLDVKYTFPPILIQEGKHLAALKRRLERE